MRPVRAELSHAHGHDEAEGRFSQFFQRTEKMLNKIRIGAARKYHVY